MKITVLVVEDDDQLREIILQTVTLEGYQTVGVSSAEAAIERLEQESFDILVTDINLPKMSGLDLLQQCARLQQGIVTIVMTGFGTIDLAVEAMKRGASDFLVKPCKLATLVGAIRVAALRVPRKFSRRATDSLAVGIVAESHSMRKLFE